MKIHIKSLWVSAVCLTAACTSSSPAVSSPNTDADLKISLDRSPCYGLCPSYAVDITGDGRVTYCGVVYVDHRGLKTRQIDPAEVAALYQFIEGADFFNLRDSYRGQTTDYPTYKVTVSRGARSKTVLDFAGASDGMPEVVTQIQKAIDAAAGTADWIGPQDYAPDPPLLKKPECIETVSRSPAFFGIYGDAE